MQLFSKIKKWFVYNLTKKPECYVHIDKPKSLQDERQLQYNKWCKRYGVYNGSYLPEDHRILTKKGWVNATSENNKSGSNEIYYRKSTGQTIRHEAKTSRKDEHYHWFSEKGYPAKNLGKDKKIGIYLDRYGKKCDRDSRPSHLAPKDKDYRWR